MKRSYQVLAALAFAAATLPGCVDANPEAARAEILANQRRNCSDYGFRPGTDAFARCMQTGINERRRAVQAAGAYSPAPVYRPQADYSRPAYIMPPIQQNRAVSCSSNAIGGTVYTNCM